MLCRSQKSLQLSINGHVDALPAYYKKFRVFANGVVLRCFAIVLLGIIHPITASHAEDSSTKSANESALTKSGQSLINAQLIPWYAKNEGLSETVINVADLDSRMKIENCEMPIAFDFPFVSHKTVRARCASPKWQHYLQISLKTTSDQTPTPSQATNSILHTNSEVGSNSKKVLPPPTPTSNAPASAQDQTQSRANPQPTESPSRTASSVQTAGVRTVLLSPQFLKRGTVLDPGMFVGTQIANLPGDAAALSNPKDVANMELLRDLPPNTPVRSFDLKPMVMVKRGQQVIVSVGEGKGFLITLRAESLQDGLLGEQIRLKNTESGRLLSAVVTGVGTAKAQ
jgi:flagellar basal body P-ring formation protein FlgA